ncbi:Protein 21.1 [Giardia lamblia P15]|uniref:Protein 21.1 n=1 Tax=Giardia intestinalis (strain P15) TaxID=658858 RepID=E1F2T6_GIAIA|nr:Protein 21.1 [Giardia lamblia P15]
MQPSSYMEPNIDSFNEVSMEGDDSTTEYISYRDEETLQESRFSTEGYEVSPSRQQPESLLTSLCPYSAAALDISGSCATHSVTNTYLDAPMTSILEKLQQVSREYSISELPLLLDAYTMHILAEDRNSGFYSELKALQEENETLKRQLEAPLNSRHTEELALIVAFKQVMEEKDNEISALKLQLSELSSQAIGQDSCAPNTAKEALSVNSINHVSQTDLLVGEQSSAVLLEALEQLAFVQSDIIGWMDSIPQQFADTVADPLKSSIEALLHSLNLSCEGTNSMMGLIALVLDIVSEKPQGVTMEEITHGFKQYISASKVLAQHLRVFTNVSNASSPALTDTNVKKEMDEAKHLKKMAIMALMEAQNARKAIEDKQKELATKEEEIEVARASASALLRAAQLKQPCEMPLPTPPLEQTAATERENCKTPIEDNWVEGVADGSLAESEQYSGYLKDMDVILDLILRIRDILFSDNTTQPQLSEVSIVDPSYSKDPLQQSIDSASTTLLSIFEALTSSVPGQCSTRSGSTSEMDEECMQSLGKRPTLASEMISTISKVSQQNLEVTVPYTCAAKPETVSEELDEVTLLKKELLSRNEIIQLMVQKLEQKDKDISRLTQQLTASADGLTRSLSVERFGEPISLEPNKGTDDVINEFNLTADVASTSSMLMKLRFDVTTKLSMMEKLMNSQGITDKGSLFSLVNHYLSLIEASDNPQHALPITGDLNKTTQKQSLDNFVCWTEVESPIASIPTNFRAALGPANEHTINEVGYATLNSRVGKMHEWHIPIRCDKGTDPSRDSMFNADTPISTESTVDWQTHQKQLNDLKEEIALLQGKVDSANERAHQAELKLENDCRFVDTATSDLISSSINSYKEEIEQKNARIQYLQAALAEFTGKETNKTSNPDSGLLVQLETMKQLLATQTADLKKANTMLEMEQEKTADLSAKLVAAELLSNEKEDELAKYKLKEDRLITKLNESEERELLIEKQTAEIADQRTDLCEQTREVQRLKLLLLDRDSQIQRVRDINERLAENIAALRIDLEQQRHLGGSQTSDSRFDSSYRLTSQIEDLKLDIQRVQMELTRMDRNTQNNDAPGGSSDSPWDSDFVSREQLIQMLVERDIRIAALLEEKAYQETPNTIEPSETQTNKPKIRSRPQSSKRLLQNTQMSQTLKQRPVSSSSNANLSLTQHGKKDATINSLKHQLITAEKSISSLKQELTSVNTKLSQAKAAEIALKKLLHEKQKEIEDLKIQNTTLTQRLDKCDRKVAALESDKCDLMARLVNATDNSDSSPQARLQKLLNSTLNSKEEHFKGEAGILGTEASDTTRRAKIGFTPLMHAITTGNSDEVTSNLAYAGYHTTNGTTALMLAVEYNNIQAIKLLSRIEARMTRDAGETALAIALTKGNFAAAKLLTETEGLNTNHISRAGGTITELMKAAADNNLVATWCYLPIQGGLHDQDGCTALMHAAKRGSVGTARLLCDKEARAQSKQGETALMFAAINGYTELVRMLKDREWGMYDIHGTTALMLAAQYNRPQIISLLIDKEARMLTKRIHEHGAGFCALMAASHYGNIECAKLLLPKEVDMKQPNGKTALSYAQSDEMWNLIKHYRKA